MANIKIDGIACIGCGACVDICPTNVFELKGVELRNAKSTAVRPDNCILCFSCTKICPSHAIEIPEDNPYNVIRTQPSTH